MPAQPTPAQQRFTALRRGLFLHFGINTYHDVEWSDGTLDPRAFAPDRLDPDGWCRTARDAGLRLVVLTAKHIDGFALWPTRHSPYGVAASPFRGDVIEQLAESCRRHDLRLGLYYALWDRRHDRGDAAYADFALAQVDELLTRYGPITELWFDGAWTKLLAPADTPPADLTAQEWQGLDEAAFLRAWRTHARPRWGYERLCALVKQRQPDCIVLNNGTTSFPGVPLDPVDARCGEKATHLSADRTTWTLDGREVYLPLQVETTLSQQGPPGPFEAGSWFWHPWDHSVASVEQVRGWVAQAEALNAVLLLNCGVMASGQLRPEDVSVLGQLGR